MVWAGVTYSGLKTLLIFIEEGVKINQHVYLHMLKEPVHPWVVLETELDGKTFQQDGVHHRIRRNWSKIGVRQISKDFGPRIFGLPALQT